MASFPCTSPCRHCRPGRPCAVSARWEAEELEMSDHPDDPTPSPRCEPWEPNTYLDRYGRQRWIDPMGGRRL